MALNARDAADRGATALTCTRAVAAERGTKAWDVSLQERGSRATRTIRARMVVNAAGRWVGQVLKKARAEHRREDSSGSGRSNRDAEALRSRPLLHLPEPGRAHLLRLPYGLGMGPYGGRYRPRAGLSSDGGSAWPYSRYSTSPWRKTVNFRPILRPIAPYPRERSSSAQPRLPPRMHPRRTALEASSDAPGAVPFGAPEAS